MNTKQVLLTLTTISLLTACGSTTGYETTKHSQAQVEKQVTTLAAESYSHESEVRFQITPGVTYVKDNGTLELYADLVHTVDGKLYVYAAAFHAGKLAPSMTIQELFTPNGNSTYKNESNTINLTFSSDMLTCTFTDKRSNVLLQFSGDLHATTPPAINLSSDNIQSEIEKGESEELPAGFVLPVDGEYSIISSDEEFRNFTSNSSSERVKVRMLGTFVRNIDSNGMEFHTPAGTTFYVFGGQYSGDSKTLQLDMIYRGQNPRFNGHDFNGTSEHCFVLDKLTQITN